MLEKVPFAILSLGSCIATLLAQNFAMASSANMPLTWRLSNAAVSYVNYLRQIFWPADLVPFYQHPEYTLALWQIIGALLLIVLVTIVAFCLRRRMPYVVVGWVWYLVTLLPVIGFVQVGLQARADRYMYLPQIGIIIAVVWLARELLIHWPRLRYVTAALALATIVLLAFLCHAQASHWRDSKSLWGYTLSKSPNNDVAHGGLGGILLTEGDLDGAVAHFERALQIRSGNVAAHNGLALAFAQQRKLDAAIEHWQKAVEILPDDTEMLNHLGAALAGVGRTEEAIEQWKRALAFDPDNIDAAVALAWTFATATDSNLRNGAKAVEYARRAASAPLGDTFMVYRTLAAACAEARDFDAAIRAAGHAQALAQAAGNQNGAAEMERWTQVFRQRQTLREAFTGR